jgi:hypothetical protein
MIGLVAGRNPTFWMHIGRTKIPITHCIDVHLNIGFELLLLLLLIVTLLSI